MPPVPAPSEGTGGEPLQEGAAGEARTQPSVRHQCFRSGHTCTIAAERSRRAAARPSYRHLATSSIICSRAGKGSPGTHVRGALVRSKAARFGRHGMLSAEGVPPPLSSVVHVGGPVTGAWQTNDERTDGRAARMSYASSDSLTESCRRSGKGYLSPTSTAPDAGTHTPPMTSIDSTVTTPCHCPR